MPLAEDPLFLVVLNLLSTRIKMQEQLIIKNSCETSVKVYM